MVIDCHCHTNCSDGSLSILERIELIKQLKFEAATITDHDFISIESVAIATGACQEIPFIPAIELTSHHGGKIVHILGYFVDPASPTLQTHIETLNYLDKIKTQQLLDTLATHGIAISLTELMNNSLHTPYYLTLVRVLAQKLGKKSSKTFAYYMGAMRESGNDWVRFIDCSVQHAIELIHAAGGITVLAHPGYESDSMMEELEFLNNKEENISLFTQMGLDGLETHCPSHSKEQYHYYAKIAQKLDLLQTEGSDCHGVNDYSKVSAMESFTLEFDDGYERLLLAYKKRYKKDWQ